MGITREQYKQILEEENCSFTRVGERLGFTRQYAYKLMVDLGLKVKKVPVLKVVKTKRKS